LETPTSFGNQHQFWKPPPVSKTPHPDFHHKIT
jgi:hypothetical protein